MHTRSILVSVFINCYRAILNLLGILKLRILQFVFVVYDELWYMLSLLPLLNPWLRSIATKRTGEHIILPYFYLHLVEYVQ